MWFLTKWTQLTLRLQNISLFYKTIIFIIIEKFTRTPTRQMRDGFTVKKLVLTKWIQYHVIFHFLVNQKPYFMFRSWITIYDFYI